MDQTKGGKKAKRKEKDEETEEEKERTARKGIALDKMGRY